MKHLPTTGLVATFALITGAASAESLPFQQDDPKITMGHPQIGVRLGYGVYTGDDLVSDVNPYSFGGGLTFGYSFGHLYLGVSGEYYAGGFQEAIDDESTANIWNAMFEPGWDIRVSKKGFILRPQVGVGVSSVHAEACFFDLGANPPTQECRDETEYKLAVAPGAMLMIDDFGGFYGQIGARYHYIFLDDKTNMSGVLISAGVGAAF